MKKIISFASMFLLLLVTSCSNGGNTQTDNADLSPKERDALKHTIDKLNSHEELESFEIVEGKMPVELMTDEFKKYRDDVFKTGMDYNNCLKRGLQDEADKQAQKLLRYQEEILVKATEWQEGTGGTSNYLFVLATIKDSSNTTHPLSKVISVYNPVTMQHDFWMPLTTPIVNNAALILNAVNGSLLEYATNPAYETKALADSINNPVLKFIFDADPATIK